jgi:hypothetical protein
MPLTKVQLKTPHLVLYIESDMGIVFNQIKQSLYQLTALSISLLLAIDEGLNKKKALEHVAILSELQVSELIEYYQEVLKLFSKELDKSSYKDAQYPELATLDKPFTVANSTSIKTYKIAQTKYSIEVLSPRLFIAISTILKPCEKVLSAVDLQVTINECTNNVNFFDIVCNGLVIEKNLPFDYVMPHLIDRLQIVSFQNSDYQYCFHGAALETNNGSLLLPGKSGAGKSTLSAVLASDNMPLYSDEMIALDSHFQIMTLNLPIAIKSGSWKILAKLFPELKSEKIWLREDGRKLKYIWPNNFVKAKKKDGHTVNKIMLVNPCFQAGSIGEEKQVVKLNTFETLELLINGGYQISNELTVEKLEKLFSYISTNTSYKLTYNSSAFALTALENLWSSKR